MNYKDEILQEKFKKLAAMLNKTNVVIYSKTTKTHLHGNRHELMKFGMINEDSEFVNIVLTLKDEEGNQFDLISRGDVKEILFLDDRNPRVTNIVLVSEIGRMGFGLMEE